MLYSIHEVSKRRDYIGVFQHRHNVKPVSDYTLGKLKFTKLEIDFFLLID